MGAYALILFHTVPDETNNTKITYQLNKIICYGGFRRGSSCSSPLQPLSLRHHPQVENLASTASFAPTPQAQFHPGWRKSLKLEPFSRKVLVCVPFSRPNSSCIQYELNCTSSSSFPGNYEAPSLQPVVGRKSHPFYAYITQVSIPNKKLEVCGSSHLKNFSNLGYGGHGFCARVRLRVSKMYCTCSGSTSAVTSGVVATSSTTTFDGVAVATTLNNESKKLKISVVVSGGKTESIFDGVFNKIVAESQPIPGFRRVKGGTTPNIPKFILLEVLGQSRIYRQAISKIINYAISSFVEKEGLKVSKDLRIEQSIEESEALFEPGEEFKFDAVLHLLD